MVVTWKWLLKNENLTTRLKNKTWTNPQREREREREREEEEEEEEERKKSDRPEHKTQGKKPEHTYFKILNATNTICGENCESLCIQVSL